MRTFQMNDFDVNTWPSWLDDYFFRGEELYVRNTPATYKVVNEGDWIVKEGDSISVMSQVKECPPCKRDVETGCHCSEGECERMEL